MYHVINNVLMGLNRVGGVFYDYAANIFIQTALLVILLFAIDLLLRKRIRAVFRYCVWLLVLVKLILPPMLSLPTGIGYWVGDHIPVAPGASNMELDAFALEHAGPSGEMPHVRPNENIAGDDPATAPLHSTLTPLTWQAVVFLLWLAGVLAFLAVLIQRIRFVKGLVAASCPAGDELLGLLEQCRLKMAVRRDIKLRLSEAVPSPAVCGLLRPTVLMPTSLVEKLSPEGLRATLIHELAHIKRGDLWVNSVQTFLQVVYFYNPFVWFANSIIRKVCEEAVDETVLVALGGQAKDYSNTLIDIGEIAFWKADLGLRLIGVAESKKALQWRIRHMLTRPIPKSSKLGVLGIGALLVIASILLPMARAEKTVEDNKPVATGNERKSASSLHEAARSGDVEQIENFIARGANVNDRNEGKKMTPLCIAAFEGHTEVVKVLLENGADVEMGDSRYTPLFYAIWSDIHATQANSEETVKALILAGANVNVISHPNDFRPLVYAIWDCQPGTVKTLLDAGADVDLEDIYGATPLYWAAFTGRRGMLEMALSKSRHEVSVIHMAAYRGDLTRVRAFVESNTGIDVRDQFNCTPLHWATLADTTQVAGFLLAKGANVNARDNLGGTPLVAARGLDMVKLLISKGADVNAKIGWYPMTRLHRACSEGNEDIADVLIANGADFDAFGLRGLSPLHLAAGAGHNSIVELLIKRGADVNAKHRIGPTVLEYAKRNGQTETVELLKKHRAKE
jgi:ankyrin repeat protein/beta-lactamase regulating signal transducer with metallopeptidase domain